MFDAPFARLPLRLWDRVYAEDLMNYKPGTRIGVRPVVFYPKGQATSPLWLARWTTCHEAASLKYSSMLKGRDTFVVRSPISHFGELSAGGYADLCFSFAGLEMRSELAAAGGCSSGVETIVAELMLHHPELSGYTRYTLPDCLSILLLDPDREWVGGGGRNLNGGLDLGAGISVIPSWQYDDGKLMSTLLHELGHAFGLPHCWERPVDDARKKACYYGESTSASVMGYNEANWTNSTTIADIPGCLLGDDIEALSQNTSVFPRLRFDPEKDFDCPPTGPTCPPHDKKTHPVTPGPMPLTFCTTDHPSSYSSISVLNDGPGRWILPSDAANGFDAQRMWHSGPANSSGWVSMEVTFPLALTLDRLQFYTEYGGNEHRAQMVQVERETSGGSFEFVRRVTSPKPAVEVTFPAAEARRWRFAFRAGNSDHVVVRGIRYFRADREYFPPLGPHALTESGETYGSQVTNLVEIQRAILANDAIVGFDARSMWHSGQVNSKGWVSIEVVFPTEVELDRIRVYSQHSGAYHRATRVQVEVFEDYRYRLVVQRALASHTTSAAFPATRGKSWKLAFKGAAGGFVVIRGLRFFIGNEEFYPPASSA